MKAYLCTPDCGPLPLADWMMLSDLRFDGIRTDVRIDLGAPAIVANVAAAGRDAIFIADARGTVDQTLAICVAIAKAAMGMGGGAALEVGNEPDRAGKWGKTPRDYGKLVAAAAELAWEQAPDLQVVSGGIATTSPDAIAWLAEAVRMMPPEVRVGFHPYRHLSQPPGLARPGYTSREAEYRALRTAAQGRALWATEVGWHTAPRGRAFPLCFTSTRWSDGEVAAFLREELRINAAQDVDVCCIYQLQDGPNAGDPEQCFGIRRITGQLKPSAYVVREWRG